MIPIKSLYFEAGSKHLEPGEERREGESFLFANGRISTHFDDIHMKLSTHCYFEVLFHCMLSKYENCKNRFL